MSPDTAIRVTQTGVTLSTSTTSNRSAVPKRADGKNAKFVRVMASVLTYIKFGNSSVAATTNDAAVQPGDAVIFNVAGISDASDGNCYVAAIVPTGSGSLNAVPLEDG